MAGYLIHFNKNHDKLGQFTFGDGDGDGTRDDHHNYDGLTKSEKAKFIKDRKKKGSAETQEKYTHLMIDKIDQKSDRKALKELNKRLNDYDKSAIKDIKKARRIGDEKAARMINAGRIFTKTQLSGEYQEKILNSAFMDFQLKQHIQDIEKFTYEMLENDELGGLDIILKDGDRKEQYFYIDYMKLPK